MARKKTQQGRRHPLASAALLVIGLFATGGVYALIGSAATADSAPQVSAAQQLEEGEDLFAANCASCHGLNAEGTSEGPSLIGVGAASVDFQIMTGRMPMAFSGPQAEQREPQFSQEQSDAIAAWVASLGVGPDVPDEEWLDYEQGDPANGGQLFRINCAMCHNVAGAGGALTDGKWAPPLGGVDPVHVYEAMLIGPQNMPVFNDANLTPEEKRDIIAFLQFMENEPSVGGFTLGALGPVSEGLFIWIFGLGGIVAITVWLTAKAN